MNDTDILSGSDFLLENKLQKPAGSVKSTKSLYFTDPEASGTMARDEEVTVNIYDIYSDEPSDITAAGGKIKRSDVTSTITSSMTASSVINGHIRNQNVKSLTPIMPRSKVKKSGSFQIKVTDSLSRISHASSSGSLHDQQFKELLSDTISKGVNSTSTSSNTSCSSPVPKSFSRQESYGDNVFGTPAALTTTPNCVTADHMQTDAAVFERPTTGQLVDGPRTDFDGGSGSRSSGGEESTPADGGVITHKTVKADDALTSRGAGDSGVLTEQSNNKHSLTSDLSSDTQIDGYTNQQTFDKMIISGKGQSTSLLDKRPDLGNDEKQWAVKVRSGPGKFMIRYKEGPDPGKAGKSSDQSEKKRETITEQRETTEKAPCIVKDETFKDTISGMIASRRIPEGSVSEPSSLLRPKKLKMVSAEISLDNQSSSVDGSSSDTQLNTSTFPRDNKNREVVSSTPTSPYEELKETVEGGTVGKLVKDIFKNVPLTGRAIDPSTLERKRVPANAETRKYNYLVEGIDTPNRPSEGNGEGFPTQQAVTSSVDKSDVTGLLESGTESLSQSPGITDVVLQRDKTEGSQQHTDTVTSTKLDRSIQDYSEEVSSLKKLEKKGFSYINRQLAHDVLKKAGDFTAKRKQESVEARVSDHQKEMVKRTQAESLILTEVKAKLQTKESAKGENQPNKDRNQFTSSESLVLLQAKSNLQKRSKPDTTVMSSDEDIQMQKSMIRSSMLLAAKAKLNKTNKTNQSDGSAEEEPVKQPTHTLTGNDNKPGKEDEHYATKHDDTDTSKRNEILVNSQPGQRVAAAEVNIKQTQRKESMKYNEATGGMSTIGSDGESIKQVDRHASVISNNNGSNKANMATDKKAMTTAGINKTSNGCLTENVELQNEDSCSPVMTDNQTTVQTKTGLTSEDNQTTVQTKTGLTSEDSQTTVQTKTGLTSEDNQTTVQTKTGMTSEDNQTTVQTKTGLTSEDNQTTAHTKTGMTSEDNQTTAHTKTGMTSEDSQTTVQRKTGLTPEDNQTTVQTKTGMTSEDNQTTVQTKTGLTSEDNQTTAHTKTGMTSEDNQTTAHTKTGMTSEDSQTTVQRKTGLTSEDNQTTVQTKTGMTSEDNQTTVQTKTGMKSEDNQTTVQTKTGMTSEDSQTTVQTKTGMKSEDSQTTVQTKTGLTSEDKSAANQTDNDGSSPSAHSLKSNEPPDSAFVSDTKMSSNCEIKVSWVDKTPTTITEQVTSYTEDITNQLHTQADAPEATSVKVIDLTSESKQNNGSSEGLDRYDDRRTIPMMTTGITQSIKMSAAKQSKIESEINRQSTDSKPVKSLRELKKLAQNRKRDEDRSASQLDIVNLAVSESTEKQTNEETESKSNAGNEDYNQADRYTVDVNNVHTENGTAPTREVSDTFMSSAMWTGSDPDSDFYTEIPIRRVTGKEMRSEIRLSDRAGRRKKTASVVSDSSSVSSFVSNSALHKHERSADRRRLQLTVNTSRHNDRVFDIMYSPGSSSTQTDNTSISVPVISPRSISGTSSVSTTAQDTFEYSHVRQRAHRRYDHIRNATMDGSVLQPLTINIGQSEPRGLRKSRKPLQAGSHSETRAHHRPHYIGLAPAVNNEQSMFRMSRFAEAEHAGYDYGRRRHSASRRLTHQHNQRYRRPALHGADVSRVRHAHRMRPRNESFNSQSSGPRSPPGRYLRVDESRGGRVPIYAGRGMTVTDLEGFEYNRLGDSHSYRQQQSQYVSQVRVEDGDERTDANSAFSEPIYTAGTGKYSVHRMMEKRGLAVVQPTHPDMQYQKKRRAYQVSGSTQDTHQVRTLNSSLLRVRTPEVTAVDPTLQEVDKKGDHYNITVKLNAVGSRPNSMGYDEVYDEQINTLNAASSRYNSYQEKAVYMYGGQRSNSYGQYDGRDLSPTNSTLRQMTLVKLKDPATLLANDGNMQAQYTTKARFKVKHDVPEVIVHGQSVSSEKEYVVKSTVGSDSQYVSRTLSPTRTGSDPPRFTMTVNQTMTMDYVAPTDDDDDDDDDDVTTVEHRATAEAAGKWKATRRQDGSGQRYKEARHSQGLLQTANTAHATSHKARSRARSKMNGHVFSTDDLENYLSPAEEKDDDQHVGNIPQVVRGSILIKNAIDTTGAPKVIDIVEGQDSDDDVIVEDNVNMFHGSYLQRRENPMYSSDQDLSDIKEKEYKPPQFTKIFNTDDDQYTEIRVNRERSRRHRSRECNHRGEQRSGYDEADIGYNDQWEETRRTQLYEETTPAQTKMSREQRTEYEISRLLKDAPQGSIKQSINVEREEEDIIGPLPVRHADGSGAKPEDMLNFDTVSEKVDLGLRDGKAEVTVKVRCERIVPIRGVEDMFKKSSVIVTRLIEIDLFATEERRRLWENIIRRTNQGAITDGTHRHHHMSHDVKLSTKDTFNLYKTFMGLAEADEAGKSAEYTQIDRQVEEERRPDLYSGTDNKVGDDQDDDTDLLGFDPEELDRKIEEQLVNNYTDRKLEPDTMSYMSAASETRDMLY